MKTQATVRERPILFSSPMVRAILAGKKHVTRRAMKPQPYKVEPPDDGCGWRWEFSRRRSAYAWNTTPESLGLGMASHCPYGLPGDRLWVRETWWSDRREPNVVVYDATPEWGKYRNSCEPVRSTHPDQTLTTREDARAAMLPKFWTKRPSIFLPRWASRITLEITGVRAERLQAITEEDAIAEGVTWNDGPFRCGHTNPISAFRGLWDQINGKKHPWASNCWVWVLAFKRVENSA